MNKFTVFIIIAVIIIIGLGYVIMRGQKSSNEQAAIQNQVSFIPTADPNQTLQITDVKVGTGSAVKAGDTVSVKYTGSLTNGQVFDSTDNHGGQPFTTQIGTGQVIKGWDQGIVGMKVGGVRKLVIPSSLGYGSQGAPPQIPPNATLIFTVELVNIQ